MTLPLITPAEYPSPSSALDFLKVKSDKSGAARVYVEQVSVPSATAATSIIGLIPFNKGARFHLDSQSVHVALLGAGTTTISIGYIYNDNVSFTNNQTAWAAASTAPQAGGFVALTAGNAGLSFIAQGDGWLVATINTAATTTTGLITINCTGSYDGVGINNSNNQA